MPEGVGYNFLPFEVDQITLELADMLGIEPTAENILNIKTAIQANPALGANAPTGRQLSAEQLDTTTQSDRAGYALPDFETPGAQEALAQFQQQIFGNPTSVGPTGVDIGADAFIPAQADATSTIPPTPTSTSSSTAPSTSAPSSVPIQSQGQGQGQGQFPLVEISNQTQAPGQDSLLTDILLSSILGGTAGAGAGLYQRLNPPAPSFPVPPSAVQTNAPGKAIGAAIPPPLTGEFIPAGASSPIPNAGRNVPAITDDTLRKVLLRASRAIR